MDGASTQTSAGRPEGCLGDCKPVMNVQKSTCIHSDKAQESDAGYRMQDA